LKRQFVDDVNRLLSNRRALGGLAETLEANPDELSLKGHELVAMLSTSAASEAASDEFAALITAFCLSPALLSFWGHFTATLSNLPAADAFINDVARCRGRGSAEDVRAAIREFGDVRRMPAGNAAM